MVGLLHCCDYQEMLGALKAYMCHLLLGCQAQSSAQVTKQGCTYTCNATVIVHDLDLYGTVYPLYFGHFGSLCNIKITTK